MLSDDISRWKAVKTRCDSYFAMFFVRDTPFCESSFIAMQLVACRTSTSEELLKAEQSEFVMTLMPVRDAGGEFYTVE